MSINYQKELDVIIKNITNTGETPTLLLHSCCAPCSSYVLEYLSEFFKITIFYYNPNIFPNEEYKKRVEEQQNFIDSFNVKNPISFIEGSYDVDKFYEIIKGLENENEGGQRCFKCYNFRLNEAGIIAKEKGFDYFTTTLSISPYKNAQKLNEIGKALEEKLGVRYLYSDFKKKNGYKRSIELSQQYNLYRQGYCGCEFSKKQAEQEKKI